MDDKGIKGLLKEDGTMAEKLNEFFPSVFPGHSEAHIHAGASVCGGKRLKI